MRLFHNQLRNSHGPPALANYPHLTKIYCTNLWTVRFGHRSMSVEWLAKWPISQDQSVSLPIVRLVPCLVHDSTTKPFLRSWIRARQFHFRKLQLEGPMPPRARARRGFNSSAFLARVPKRRKGCILLHVGKNDIIPATLVVGFGVRSRQTLRHLSVRCSAKLWRTLHFQSS